MWSLTTFESVLTMKFWWPRAFILRRPRSKASYSVVLLVDDSRLPKLRRAAYLVFAPEGDSMIAAMPAPSLHQAPSQCTIQVSVEGSSLKVGDVQSAMKSANTCDLMVVLLSMSM